MASIAQSPQNAPTQKSPEPLEILDMRLIAHRSIKAECRVRYAGFIFGGVKVICGALASRPRVEWPARKIDEHWVPLILCLSPEVESKIVNAVLASFRSTCRGEK